MRPNHALSGPDSTPTTPDNTPLRSQPRGSYITMRRLISLENRLTETDWLALELIERLDYVTSGQVERALLREGTPLAHARATRRRLQRLHDRRLLHRLDRPIGGLGGGSAQSIYTLDRAGQRLLDRRHDRDPRPVRSAEERGLASITHTLTVTEHYVRLAEHLREDPAARLLNWLGEPGCHRRYMAGGRERRLTPDALVEVGRGDELIVTFLEVDRGTESLPTLIHKATGYIDYARRFPNDSPHIFFSFLSSSRHARFRVGLDRLSDQGRVTPNFLSNLFSSGSIDDAVTVLASGGGRP